MFQGFEWYIPADHHHWVRLTNALPTLAFLGITRMWIPPATKATSCKSNGYDIYDLYDLGEFQQKGSRHTKFGTKEELVQLVNVANKHGIGILFDAVLNHKAGADHTETAVAVEVDPKGNRLRDISKPQRLQTWTRFDFPGRGNAHSSFKWNKAHFTGVDYDQRSKTSRIWRFQEKKWAQDVDEELANYDYLMFSDVDHHHTDVRRDLFHWAEWLGSHLKLGGLRLDAIKHYSASFLRDLMAHIDQTVGKDWYMVGEYWIADAKVLAGYIEYMKGRLSLFDVPLAGNFSKVSCGIEPDMRKLFHGSLATVKPANAVTFVRNHDTQPGQALETPIEPFFVPIAYAIVLLRANFGLPCIFWADLYGSRYPHRPQLPPHGGMIVPRLMLARKLWAYGTEVSYFADSPSCIGFTRFGHPLQSGGAGIAVVANIGWVCDKKRMCVGQQHAGERWTDVLGQAWGEVSVDETGYGTFPVIPRGVTLWANKEAMGRNMVESFVLDHGNYGLMEKLVNSEDLLNHPTEFPAWLQSALQIKSNDLGAGTGEFR